MTGLTQETAEPLQVQNYGIGGHYAPHFDHRIKRDKPFGPPGNRIATVLLYVGKSSASTKISNLCVFFSSQTWLKAAKLFFLM